MSMYDVLRVSQDSSIEEIKAAYKSLCLQLHPDKTNASAEQLQLFSRVQKAWEVLQDPELRHAHDRELSGAGLRGLGPFYQEELELNEMDVVDDCHIHECRCGDVYSLPTCEAKVVQGSVAVPCRTCSNQILVTVTKSAEARHPG